MRLWEYVDKKVEIITTDNDTIRAFVNAYEDDTANDEGVDSIDYTKLDDTNDTPYIIFENEIKSIKAI